MKLYATLLLLLCLTTFSCNKKNTTNNPGTTNTYTLGINANCGSTFTFQGNNIEIQDICATSTGYSGYPDSVSVDFLGSLLDQVNGINEITLRYGTWRGSSDPTDAEFQALFTKGPKPFTTELGNGVQIEVEINGVVYYGEYGSSSPASGNLTVNDVKFITEGGLLFAKVDATFNCTVYDNMSNSYPITNGRFVGTFANKIR